MTISEVEVQAIEDCQTQLSGFLCMMKMSLAPEGQGTGTFHGPQT